MSPRTPRRLGSLPAALIGLLVAALLSGCGAAGRPGTALVVDSQVYTPAQIVETTAQINEAISVSGQTVSEAQVVNLLMVHPFVLAEATSRGLWGPDNPYNSFMTRIPNPTPTTVAAIQTSVAYPALDEEGRAAVLDKVKAASIAVDPRYGTLDRSTGFLGAGNPDWIVRTPKAAADK
ncbi:MAG: hypothetical protein IPF90_00885 [Actinomycetales bacterium]|nr:hypothetical protein [Candidatus Phosphoribacter baldrii]